MASLDDEIKRTVEFLKALDGAIEKGPWEESLFLRGIGKKLLEVRTQYVKELGIEHLLPGSLETAATAEQQPLLDAESTEVYVSLYQAEGANMAKWARILLSLTQLSITRPTYRNEDAIQETIRAKQYKINDAYVAVKIRKDDILAAKNEKAPTDRFGHELLVLRENVIRPENITRFTHSSGHYRLVDGALIKQFDPQNSDAK